MKLTSPFSWSGCKRWGEKHNIKGSQKTIHLWSPFRTPLTALLRSLFLFGSASGFCFVRWLAPLFQVFNWVSKWSCTRPSIQRGKKTWIKTESVWNTKVIQKLPAWFYDLIINSSFVVVYIPCVTDKRWTELWVFYIWKLDYILASNKLWNQLIFWLVMAISS